VPPESMNFLDAGNLSFVIVRLGCAPCKGGVLQWVKIPPGQCSSRKLPEQLWR
jgi:hypothetical protein